MADAAYLLPSFLDLGAGAERAGSLALAREQAAAFLTAASAQLNISGAFSGISMLESRWFSPDPRRFGDLDAAVRGAFLQHLVDGFPSLSGAPENAQHEVLCFLARALETGAVPAERRDAVVARLGAELDARAAALASGPLPGPEAFDTDFLDRVGTLAVVAKAIGRREALDPFLERFLVQFPGTFYLPAETPADFAARRAATLSLWHREGVLLLDRAGGLSRDRGRAVACFAGFARAEAPLLGGVHHAVYLALLDPLHPENNHAGSRGWVWLQSSVSETDDTQTLAAQDCFGLGPLLEHEAGHNLHRNLPHPADVAMAQLYERSDLSPDPDHFFQTQLWGYGASSYTEEAAEAVAAYFGDAQGQLDRALALARGGKPLLLQKFLVWAGELARLPFGKGGGSFPLYRRTTVPFGAGPLTQLAYRVVDRMWILARDGEDRIVRMADSRASYQFTYTGRQLTGVTTGPPPGLDFYTLPPCRLVDTRTAGGPIAPGGRRDFVLAGACGVPANARALALNVTVTRSTAAGHLTLFPTHLPESPAASTINFAPGQTRANQAIVPLGLDASGAVAVQSGSAGTVDLLLDVTGYFR